MSGTKDEKDYRYSCTRSAPLSPMWDARQTLGRLGNKEMNTGKKASRDHVVEGLGRSGFHQAAAIFPCLPA